MSVKKNFIVRQGIEVADTLIVAQDGKVGIGTSAANYTLDVIGDISLSGRIFVDQDVQPSPTTGILSAVNPNSILGVNTSLFRIGDVVNDGPRVLNSKVVTIGISSIGILPSHGIGVGFIATTVNIFRDLTAGEDGQFLISRGVNLQPTWRTISRDTIVVGSSNTTQVTYPLFSSGIGSTAANINQTQLSFIPASGNLGLGTTNPTSKLTVVGNANFNGNVFIRDNVGIGTTNPLTQLHLSGFNTTNSNLKIGSLEFQNYSLNNSFFGDNVYWNGSAMVRRSAGHAGLFYFLEDEGQFRLSPVGLANSETINSAQLKINSNGAFGIGSSISQGKTLFTGSKFYVNPDGVVMVGTISSTGTSSQPLQVTGGAYVSGNIGVGTTNPQQKIDVVGSISFTDKLYAPTAESLVLTGIGTVNAALPTFVSISTSGLALGYVVKSLVGIPRIDTNTTITSIGVGSIGISKPHLLGVGIASTTLSFFIPERVSFGSTNQILVSRGSTQSSLWTGIDTVLNDAILSNASILSNQTRVEETNTNGVFYPVFSSVNAGFSTLRVNSDSLSFNPASNSLGIGTSSPSTTLEVVGNVTAINYFGNGAALSGIVTQITAGIGIDLTPTTGKGNVVIDAYRPTGKTIYVNQNGSDNNSGLTENDAKRTIKAASNVSVNGDTIKVFPGVYVEDNPIVLKKTVSVQGTELRNCVVTPKYPYNDLFYVNNGCHITNLSFIGPDMTEGAAVVALQKLQGVAVDRYFDAARMIRYNLDYIAAETVGYLTSTSYKNPTFKVVNSLGITTDPINCRDDIKDIWKCVIHDITRGGNSKCVGAGLSYYSGNTLVHIAGTDVNGYSVRQATVDAINYSFDVARAVVNNVSWGGTSVGIATTVTNALYNNVTGVTTITATNHGLAKDDAVRIVGLGFTCPSGPGIVTYPTGSLGYIFNVLRVVSNNSFEVVVGQSTLPHNYVSGGTVQKFTNFQNNFTQVKDLSIQNDPLTGFNNAINGCANVISAMRSCVGVVTSIVGLGATAFSGVGIRTTHPGNSGIGFTTVSGITSAVYNEETGKITIQATGLKAIQGESIELRDLAFSCNSGGGISTQRFPSGRYGYDFVIDKLNQNGTIEVYVGPSTLPHNYAGGGIIVDRILGVTTASYNTTTGIVTIRASGLSIETGDLVRIRNLQFSTIAGIVTFPTISTGYDFKVLDIITDKPVGVTSAIYNNTTGITTITAPGIGVTANGIVELRNLEFSCSSGAGTTTLYPTGNNGYRFRVLSSIGSTFTVNVGPSTIAHNYVSGGTAINRTLTANDTFTINIGTHPNPATYVSGGVVIPPFSRGVGPITQGPYIRNCTNFIPKSIGMKVDGFEAEPGDQDDIGVTGTMSVDSYTQYNQGGIGVSITNGAYAQLVSIFTICDDIAIYTSSGGQCDITNSNSSFGRIGLFSNGVGDQTTKSVYRYTGVANTSSSAKTNIVTVSGVGSNRPYDGQVCYFGELYYFVDSIQVTNGGSGYTISPTVTISSPEGQNGITAQATATIQNGSVTAINIVNSGSQYRKAPTITIAPPPSGTQATASVFEMQPIYYKVTSATLPSAGISTVTFLQTLNNDVGIGTTVYFYRGSLQLATTISFEYVGAGTNINSAKPALGGVVNPDNQVVQKNGGIVVYTSTDQSGNFKIGDGVVINQATGQISGRDFTKALFTTMTPFILALSD
jgi:hypothetical protein